jgi:hypothetical protein
MHHDLTSEQSHPYMCRTCGQTWQTRPRSKCPGITLYPKYGHEPLLTRLQLGYIGYEIAPRLLPAPAGCCRSNGKYLMLYDPSQAAKKQTQPRHRVTRSVTELYWPQTLLPYIDAYLRSDSFNRRNELADIAFHLSAFTASEVERFAGDVLRLVIAPCLVHMSYQAFQRAETEQAVLVKSVVAAYQKYRDLQ